MPLKSRRIIWKKIKVEEIVNGKKGFFRCQYKSKGENGRKCKKKSEGR